MKVRIPTVDRLLRFTREDKGAALAELAILVPFLVIMLAAVAEFGRFFQTYTTLAKATRSSARYLSNHKFTVEEQDRAKNLVVCGKLDCTGSPPLVTGITAAKVCIQTTGAPKIETVTVSIPRDVGDCGAPHEFAPIFNIGALLHNAFDISVPISTSTTMYYMID